MYATNLGVLIVMPYCSYAFVLMRNPAMEMNTFTPSRKPSTIKMYFFFVWLIIQNRVWTSDRLVRWSWTYCPVCCRQIAETAYHILVGYRYPRRIWSLCAKWTGQPNLRLENWPKSSKMQERWTNITTEQDTSKSAQKFYSSYLSVDLEGKKWSLDDIPYKYC